MQDTNVKDGKDQMGVYEQNIITVKWQRNPIKCFN